MKKSRTVFSSIMTALLCFSFTMMTACGENVSGSDINGETNSVSSETASNSNSGTVDNSSSESTDDGALVNGKAVVTFDTNLDGTYLFDDDINTVKSQSVEPGQKAIKKTLVVKSSANNMLNVGFRGWYIDKEGTTEWDFDTPVTKSMTLYAKWEARYKVSYHVGTNDAIEENVFSGELVSAKDSDAGWKNVLGWYTTSDFSGTAYDFTQPVTSNMDLYASIEDGIYIAGSRMSSFTTGYGQGTQSVHIGESTITVETNETTGETYARMSLAQAKDSTWITYGDFNERLNNLADKTERYGDYMTVTYKNLGEAQYFRFYYVVGYDKTGGFQYSSITNGQPVGGWNIVCVMPIETNMSEDDEWATVTFDMVELTKVAEENLRFGTGFDADVQAMIEANIVDGYVSEWGLADMLCNVRFDACKYPQEYTGTYQTPDFYFSGNEILIKSIRFTANDPTASNN
jgi:uncharacterized repeat protein (TIGR02543 family)